MMILMQILAGYPFYYILQPTDTWLTIDIFIKKKKKKYQDWIFYGIKII